MRISVGIYAATVYAQARHFKQNGQMYVARIRLGTTTFFEGLFAPPDADFSLSFGRGSLSDWKQRLWIGERGEDWEQQFVKGKKNEREFAPVISP